MLSEATNGFDSAVKVSWSQGGEDLALLSVFSKIRPGRYIDIGAHHPSRFSNTRHLYQMGWTGVNIDADQDLVDEFLLSRPKDVSFVAAIGSQPEYVLHVFNEKLVSTTDSARITPEVSIGRKYMGSRKVRGVSLRKVIDDYFPEERVDLISIDIEGSDFDALSSIDFDTLEFHRWPEFILVETYPPVTNALSTDAVQLAVDKGYVPLLVLPLATLLRIPIDS